MKIFISYRRADSQSNTDRIHEHLAEAFGADNVFQDVLDIDYGHDFRQALREQVATCDVLLAIIGPQWATISDQDGARQPRIFNPDDFVRFEVETGLTSDGVLVIPVLVNGAAMPDEDQLPSNLQPLRFRNAITVRNNPDFDEDIARLIRQLHDHAHAHGIRIRRAALPSWRWVAAVAVIVAVLTLGFLLALDPFAADSPPVSTESGPPDFVAMDQLFFEHLITDFEATPSETLPEAALEGFLAVNQVFWGELPTLETYGYDIRLIITNTGTQALKLALDERYFALEDEQGQQADLLYFCCETESTILNPDQQREVRLIFEERENWGGASGKYEGGGVETTFFLRINGFLPVVRATWQLDVPLMAE